MAARIDRGVQLTSQIVRTEREDLQITQLPVAARKRPCETQASRCPRQSPNVRAEETCVLLHDHQGTSITTSLDRVTFAST